jgi:hypothetical protein
VQGIADWVADWAKWTTEYEQNFIVLGDFNIDRAGDPAYEAFISRDLEPAPFHQKLPRTIFDKDHQPDKTSFYDQIAWFDEKSKRQKRVEREIRWQLRFSPAGLSQCRPHLAANEFPHFRPLSSLDRVRFVELKAGLRACPAVSIMSFTTCAISTRQPHFIGRSASPSARATGIPGAPTTTSFNCLDFSSSC